MRAAAVPRVAAVSIPSPGPPLLSVSVAQQPAILVEPAAACKFRRPRPGSSAAACFEQPLARSDRSGLRRDSASSMPASNPSCCRPSSQKRSSVASAGSPGSTGRRYARVARRFGTSRAQGRSSSPPGGEATEDRPPARRIAGAGRLERPMDLDAVDAAARRARAFILRPEGPARWSGADLIAIDAPAFGPAGLECRADDLVRSPRGADSQKSMLKPS